MINRTRILLVALVVLGLVVGGCRDSATEGTGDVTMTLDVQPDPPAVGESTLILTLTDANGDPIAGATVSAKGDMSHAGMVPVLGDGETGPDGVVEIPFEWTMGGDWFVTVDATLPDGKTASQRFDLSVTSNQ